MKEKLNELRTQYDQIIQQIQFMEQQRQALINEALRLEGKIQLLEELLNEDNDANTEDS